jgi:hypothetical protein
VATFELTLPIEFTAGLREGDASALDAGVRLPQCIDGRFDTGIELCP